MVKSTERFSDFSLTPEEEREADLWAETGSYYLWDMVNSRVPGPPRTPETLPISDLAATAPQATEHAKLGFYTEADCIR